MRSAEVTLLEACDGKSEAKLKQRYNRAEVELLSKRYKRSLAARIRAVAGDDGSLRLEQVLQLIEESEFGEP